MNRYACWALASGTKPDDTVSLLMPTRTDYVAAWLGISQVGGVAALINTKLAGSADEGGGRFEGYTDGARPRRRPCGTFLRRATPGSVPAI